MRLAFVAVLALLGAAPALAGSTSTINVGLVVTGTFASSLAGTWHSNAADRGAIYHFVVGSDSGAFYKLVSIALPGTGRCDLRVGGMITSFEPTSGSRYEMHYSVQSADVITSEASGSDCNNVAASYLGEFQVGNGTQSLILSRAGDGRLIDSATGTEYMRAR